MNIEQAKTIPLSVILEKMSAKRMKQSQNFEWYLSPLRDEKTASLQVNIPKNIWYDFGEGIGGNSLDLVCEYLKRAGVDSTPRDALRWLQNMTGFVKIYFQPLEVIPEKKSLIVKDVMSIKHKALLRYIKSRGINIDIAKIHMKQVLVENIDKNTKFLSLGMKNENGGWELRNPYFKGCIGIKSINIINGSVPKPLDIEVFEGSFDFLTFLTIEKKEKINGHSMILHSLANINKGLPYIKGYGYQVLRTWLDNDNAGQQATDTFAKFTINEPGLRHFAMNASYAGHNDLNAWHMNNLGLKVKQ